MEVVQKETLAEMNGGPQYDAWWKLILAKRPESDFMGNPWDDWVPGALNKPQMKKLLDGGYITHVGLEPKLGHSSMDLSLADEAY
jgi:hypothetical protein